MPMTYTSSSLPIAVLLFGLSFFPAFIAQRIFIFLIFLLAFLGALSLCLFLKFERKVSFFVSLIYAFSPVMYSRLVAGHIDMLLGVALMPAIARLIFASFDKPRTREVILAIVLLSIASSHFLPIFNLGIFIVIAFVFLGQNFWKKLKTILLIVLGYAFINFYWLLPFGMGMISGKLYYKGLSRVADEINYRWQQFLHSAMSFTDILGLKAPVGMGTEYVFPEPELIVMLKLFVFSGLLILGVGYLFRYKSRRQLIFLVGYLLGGVLILGPKTPLGIFLYRILMKVSPPVFFLFCNTNRFNLLLVFSFIFFIGFTLDYLLKSDYFSKSKRPQGQILLLSFWLLVSSFPFWTGRISQPVLSGTQPLCLEEKNFSSLDKLVYQEINKDDEDSRVTLIPSGHRSYLPISSFSFPWSIWYLGKDEFYGHEAVGGSYGKFIYANLYQPDIRTKNLSKLLGLAAVKRVLFYDELHYIYHSFGHWQEPSGHHETLFDPQGQLKTTFLKQEGLTKECQINDKLVFYLNESYRPRLTISEKAYLSTGDFGVLESLFSAKLAELPVVFARQMVGQNLPSENFIFIPRTILICCFYFSKTKKFFISASWLVDFIVVGLRPFHIGTGFIP
jgi:MFS family permease